MGLDRALPRHKLAVRSFGHERFVVRRIRVRDDVSDVLRGREADDEIFGHRVVRHIGVVRGIIVRSRSFIGNFGASIQAIFGGNISLYTNLCERTREDAFNRMLTHAGELGANAVIGVRYDATELGENMTEVLAYGTAVFVQPA